MKRTVTLVLLFVAVALTGQKSAYLDINKVKAIINNRNDMFMNQLTKKQSYEVPKGKSRHSNFANSLWLAGLDPGSQLHVAAMTYRQKGVDFWPGPLDTLTATADSATVANFDRLWKINRVQIDSFLLAWSTGSISANTYTPAESILTWPAHGSNNNSRQLAPFVDVNSNGVYDPLTGGDYPRIKGDQMIYYICNDNHDIHGETQGLPFGIEMHVSAYAFNCPAVLANYPELDYVTFYHYRIINRSATRYSNMIAAIWSDIDLGKYNDDYMGCDTLNNLAYIYNSSPNDFAYQPYPPITSYQILKGPPAIPGDGFDNDHNGMTDEPGEQIKLSSFMYYLNNLTPAVPANTNPQTASDYYSYMKGMWLDGSPLRADSSAFLAQSSTVAVTKHVYPGDPQQNTGWTELTRNNTPGDRRMIIGNGYFTLEANSELELEYSILTTFDSTQGGYLNIDLMRSENSRVRDFYSQSVPAVCTSTIGSTVSLRDIIDHGALSIVPNPVKDVVRIVFSSDEKMFDVQITNNLGSVIFRAHAGGRELEVNMEEFPPGVYIVKVSGKTGSRFSRLIRN